MLGPRIGRFRPGGKGNIDPAISGHSIPLTALGAFILIFGFMAFNGGSQVIHLFINSVLLLYSSITATVDWYQKKDKDVISPSERNLYDFVPRLRSLVLVMVRPWPEPLSAP